ncbi:type II toxin-antitoxin system HicA family toxin [Alkaliphilus hydrothermalis]|uniref:RNA binding protein YcfA (HicA-like mRNA interferase family) n=1 Tax=Alkaliphilus hydrothermalis TaxID=1482730 RepID=A0ABS2NT86_9FIRM|nr:type II toxin-antitoxin system HicA family toxin [Alkaliphilus hydrothermalis]MBM7616121.1 putative RNA binding protein YcfA (HicA-like mRNA interferase family) [Alkaliphilus hydrothermalis]
MATYASKELLKLLFEDGWYEKAQKGSHVHLVHSIKKGKVTVPHPRKDVPEGTAKNILRQAGLLK